MKVRWRARGRVFKRGYTWCYEVYEVSSGRVLVADDTRNFQKIYDGCCEDVWAFHTVLATGQKIPYTWREVVDAEDGEL